MAGDKYCSECGNKRSQDAPLGLCPTCLLKTDHSGLSSVDQSDVPTQAMPMTVFMPPEPAELAGQFPNLDIIELLGQGGMGAVYKARQTHLDRVVALKILPPHIGQTKAFSERFLREARSLARLNHTRIVSVYDFGRTESNLYYFVMEFVDGLDLRRAIQSRELSVSDILAITPQICEALEFAHQEGIVHRDIKPENILLTQKGQVKIADFGLAKLVDRPVMGHSLTHVGQVMGTPQYMAPEQIERPNDVDHRADIYSLGVVFYEMLTGELPLGRFALPSEKTRTDTRLDKVVLRALDKEPQKRYQRASDVKSDVETILSGKSSVTAYGSFMEDDLQAIRQRLQKPAIGLKIAGMINCITALPILLSWIGLAMAEGATSPISIILAILGLAFAALGLVTRMGAQQMVQLQSYGLAVTGGIIQLIPSPGSLIGIWFGIWALILMTQDQIHGIFVSEIKPEEMKMEGRLEKLTLSTSAVAATFVLFLATVGSLGHIRFFWLVALLGPPLVILDIFAYEVCTGQAGPDLKRLWEQVKGQIKKRLSK